MGSHHDTQQIYAEVDHWAERGAKGFKAKGITADELRALSPFSVHRELQSLSRSGIPNAVVLRIATINSARAIERGEPINDRRLDHQIARD